MEQPTAPEKTNQSVQDETFEKLGNSSMEGRAMEDVVEPSQALDNLEVGGPGTTPDDKDSQSTTVSTAPSGEQVVHQTINLPENTTDVSNNKCYFKRSICQIHRCEGRKTIDRSKRWGEIKTGYGWIHSRKVRYICMVGKSERVVSTISTHVEESRKSKPGDYLNTKGGVARISGGDNAGFEK